MLKEEGQLSLLVTGLSLFTDTIYYHMIKIPIEIGDTVYVGKFKNKRIVVKSITYNEYGLPLINGRPLLTMRIEKLMPKKLDESDVKLRSILNNIQKSK